MKLEHKAEMAGRVKLQISGGARGTIDYPWFDNMILDQGFVTLLTEPGSSTTLPFSAFGVGTSSQPVAPSDTGLISPIAMTGGGTQSAERGWDEEGGFGWSRRSRSFGRGAAAGNLSEVACFTDAGANWNNFGYSRALIKDAVGNPTAITVLSDEVLTVTWEIRRWWVVMPDHTIEYDDDGTTATTVASYTPLELMGKSSSGLGSGGDKGFGGTMVGVSTAEKNVFFSEAQGNPQVASLGYPSSNLGGALFPYQGGVVTFTPPIPKTNEFTLSIVWRLTLARRAP